MVEAFLFMSSSAPPPAVPTILLQNGGPAVPKAFSPVVAVPKAVSSATPAWMPSHLTATLTAPMGGGGLAAALASATGASTPSPTVFRGPGQQAGAAKPASTTQMRAEQVANQVYENTLARFKAAQVSPQMRALLDKEAKTLASTEYKIQMAWDRVRLQHDTGAGGVGFSSRLAE